MTGLRVSELAARAGVTASAVRFYERAGLLQSARRAANGYRFFDESALEDLALIGQAKGVGMNLDEIASLITAWRGGECQDLHALLRVHLTERGARLSAQIAELALSREHSRTALDRLMSDQPAPERCHADCGCSAALRPAAGEESPRPAGCTLDDAELADRLGQWRALATRAQSAEHDGGSLRLTLAPGLILDAAALIAVEAACCPRAVFTLEVTAGRAFLTAEFPTGPTVGVSVMASPDTLPG